MARTSQEHVISILGPENYDNDANPDLSRFIDTAGILVDYVVTRDVDGIMSTNALELVERWLAAHFYAHSDQLMQTSGNKGANMTFQGQTAMVLSSTQYGQTAMLLDLTNTLAQRSKEAETGMRQVASIESLAYDTGAIDPNA